MAICCISRALFTTPHDASACFISKLLFSLLLSMACRKLLPSRFGGIRFGIPLQKLHPLSRAIHHRYSTNNAPPQRHYTSLSRLPVRPPRSRAGHGYQQQRSFWVARLAARLLKLRYILLGSAVGGGYTAKKVQRITYSSSFPVARGGKYFFTVNESVGVFVFPVDV